MIHRFSIDNSVMMKRHCRLLLLSCLGFALGAGKPLPQSEQEADTQIAKLYHSLNQLPKEKIAQRLEYLSEWFLDKPYRWFALGEGPNALYDQYPRYRTDAFDCLTYVEMVLGLSLASDLEDFKQRILKIRYKNGQVSFLKRNHFTDLDWNQNNQQQGLLRDITADIRGPNRELLSKRTDTYIDKPSWYRHMQSSRIRFLPDPNEIERQKQALAKLQEEGQKEAATYVHTLYIPLTAIFDNQGQVKAEIANQIPNASIIEIVRPNWDLEKTIGTRLNISHLGLVFRQAGQLEFYQASSELGKVVKLPLANYLKGLLKSPTIKGINIQSIIAK